MRRKVRTKRRYTKEHGDKSVQASSAIIPATQLASCFRGQCSSALALRSFTDELYPRRRLRLWRPWQQTTNQKKRDRNMENATGRSMFPAEHEHMDSGRQLGPNSCIMLSCDNKEKDLTFGLHSANERRSPDSLAPWPACQPPSTLPTVRVQIAASASHESKVE